MSDVQPEQPTQPTPGGGMTGGHATPVVGMLLVILGGAALIGSPFLPWVGDEGFSVRATEIGVTAFWSASPDFDVGFFASAGFSLVIVGAITLIGLAPGARPFGILGGALGLLAPVLVAVSAFRGGLGFDNLRLGLYLAFVGGLLAVIGAVVPTGPPADAVPAEPPGDRPPA